MTDDGAFAVGAVEMPTQSEREGGEGGTGRGTATATATATATGAGVGAVGLCRLNQVDP
jgi:hypothetical protein